MDKLENKRLNTPLTHKFTCVDLNGYIFPFVRLCLTKPLHSHSPINPCKGNQIPEPRKCLLLESKIKQIFAVESRIQVPLTKYQESNYRNPEYMAWIPESRTQSWIPFHEWGRHLVGFVDLCVGYYGKLI